MQPVGAGSGSDAERIERAEISAYGFARGLRLIKSFPTGSETKQLATR